MATGYSRIFHQKQVIKNVDSSMISVEDINFDAMFAEIQLHDCASSFLVEEKLQDNAYTDENSDDFVDVLL